MLQARTSVAFATLSSLLPAAAFAQAQTTRESLSAGGAEIVQPCHAPSLSGSGDRVAFVTAATGVAPGDTNAVDDVFVRIRSLGTTVLASASVSGSASASGASFSPSMSSDGRWVVFASTANDLVPGDANSVGPDVFLKDLQTGAIELLSRRASGTHPSGVSTDPQVSGGAAGVTFATNAALFDAASPFDQIALVDRTTVSVSVRCLSFVGTTGAYANAHCSRPAISRDGSIVAFETTASNLIIGDTNGRSDVYVWSRETGRLVRVSSSTVFGESDGDAHDPSVSDDGRFVAFHSTSTNLVAGDTNAASDVFVFDRETATLTRKSTTAAGAEVAADSANARLSGDGRWLAFLSEADDLAAGDLHAGTDAFQKDLATGAIVLLSVSTSGDASDASPLNLATDRDGRLVAFESAASTLAVGDLDLVADVYLRDRGFTTATTVCAGDGSGAACACSNPGDLGHGCENYGLTGGALLAAVGTPSVASPTLKIAVSGCPQSVTAVLFQGTSIDGGGFGVQFGDGLRCVAGSIARIGRKVVSLEGSAEFGFGVPGDPPISVEGFVPPGGGRRYYQVVYRIQGSFCFAAPVNSSNSLAVDWFP